MVSLFRIARGFSFLVGMLCIAPLKRIKHSARVVALGLFFLFQSAFGWNAVGHRVIVQIAYHHLSPAAKHQFNVYNHAVDQNHRRTSFVNAGVWLDRLYNKKLVAIKRMHYIDLPFSDDQTRLPPVHENNAVWGINMAERTLLNTHASNLEKGIALRILLHVVGDIHQPLHATTKVSQHLPNGDHGGNLNILHENTIATNLHAYWDRGAGLLLTLPRQRNYQSAQIRELAYRIEQHKVCNKHDSLDPMQWAKESHAIAVEQVYRLLDDNHVDISYQQMAQTVSMERIALAGCRLAVLLNRIAKENDQIKLSKKSRLC